ncbi:MAG: hypothetical protein VCC00_04705 [Deltaproteobacteria bacterium]
MSNPTIVRAALVFAIAALIMPARAGASEARCASDMQKEYGKYYSCALKEHAKATKKGGTADLTRCQAKLDKKLDKLEAKYGTDCVNADAATIAGIADQCIGDTAAVATGLEPVHHATGVVCSPNALTADLATRPKFSAKNPPQVESMSLTPLGGGLGLFEIQFADTRDGYCLPSRLELDFGDRAPVVLVAQDRGATFSAEVRIDSTEWKEYESALAEAARAAAGEQQPVFDGRVLREQRLDASAPIDLSAEAVLRSIALPLQPIVPPFIVDAERTLMVTDVSVVEDPARTFDPCDPVGTPMGPWTFGYLMQEMANQPLTGIAPTDLVLDWMDQWTTVQTVNGMNIPARVAMQNIIDRWLVDSAATGTPPGQLDLSIAPFRLMAIVNRVDLRNNASYGGGNCGEGRFVFGVLNTDTCQPMRFTVIFEYGVNMTTCRSCRKYAGKWLDLQTHPLGSPAYLSSLEALTHVFSDANTNPGKPNGNSINQIRTNEIAIGSPWEMREFNLDTTGFLGHVTNKQNPREDFNFTPALANWVNANAVDICAGNYTVPDTLGGTPFLAAHVPYPFGAFFDGPAGAASIPDRCARFQLSINSCSGCHAGETATVFTHVGDSGRRFLGSPAQLSAFLTGAAPPNPVADPADGAPFRAFNDLARRQIDLWQAAHVPCLPTLAFKPLKMVH